LFSDNKIVNWEIIKHLPKPIIPIVFYQIQNKLNSLSSYLSDLSKINSELNDDIKNKIDKLKNTERVVDETNHNNKSNKNEHLTAKLVEKLNHFEKNLSEQQQENLEIENNLRKKVENFKTQIELDENKYNEENLKKIKTDIETLMNGLKEKIKTAKDENEKLNQIFNSNKEFQLNEVVLSQLESEFEERKKTRPLTQHLQSLFTANTVRPASGVSNSSNDSGDNQPANYSLRASQKSKIFHSPEYLLIFFSLQNISYM
jgi:hypothetical protein